MINAKITIAKIKLIILINKYFQENTDMLLKSMILSKIQLDITKRVLV